jgi:hypothetical protein
LTDRYVGPFKVFKTVNLNVYELELSAAYKVFYRTFPIFLLKPYSRKKSEKPPKLINLNEKDRFQIKSIRKERGTKENPQFLIKWYNYPKYKNI